MTGKGIGTALLALVAGTAFAAEVLAAPLQPALPSSSRLVIPAGACHGDVQTHYVPEVAGTIPHYHTGGNCRPIAAQGQGQPGAIQQDCHRDVQLHHVPGVGEVYHRHNRSCQVVLAEQQTTDCHNDVRLHSVPGLGEVYHAHRGPNCQVVEYEPSQGPSQPGCIQIGPVRVCP